MLARFCKYLLLALIVGTAKVALAAGGDDDELKPYQDLIEASNFEKAISQLDAALATDSDNADLLNLNAYSHRQLKHYEIALNYYQKALELKPRHRGANEYLGELYLHLGQLDQAEARLEVLDRACFFGCKEFDQLEQAIEEYRAQNPS